MTELTDGRVSDILFLVPYTPKENIKKPGKFIAFYRESSHKQRGRKRHGKLSGLYKGSTAFPQEVFWMQRYDAVLFDVDGTLIHSRPGIFNCFAYAFRKMGLDPDAIDCSRYLGPPLRWSFAQHFATDAEVEQAVEYYRVHYEEVGSHQCSLFPGVRQMMDTLKDAGLYMATATCKPVEVVTPILKEQGLFDYFDRVGGASMDESVDNKTDVIRLVLQDPRLAGKRILMVGDRQDDMQGAVNNQLPAAAVLYGYGSREEMEPWNPVLLAQNCEELTQYILG